ncbi:CoA pyrophosphatase [Occultella glacieicola]|uniref:CoA pyrophosphatase n=1 Tax=Occultella glacieicola TaxID=2518684 RepID=A0ABY2E9N3_9MICO|nr:CoA pyrophosphatase [Occultella glacieicola]TDE97485.1 CoA pyrophosphatase [Occultella glacieicola]
MHPSRAGLTDLAARAAAGRFEPLGGAHAYSREAAKGFRRSGVLLLFTPTASPGSGADSNSGQGLDLFLVQRSPLLRHHPGQIALPGGRLEPGEDAVAAAVREAHEETGISPDQVEVLGPIPPVLVPLSEFVVTPVLAWSETAHAGDEVEPGEVLHTLRVPVAELLDPAARATVRMGGFDSHGFRRPTGWVWGFTGNLLDHVFDQLGWALPWDRGTVYRMGWDEARGAGLLPDAGEA